MRRCIACRESKPQNELVRFTFSDGIILADSDAKADGRGIYLCRSRECADMAIKRKSFNRILRKNLDNNMIEKALNDAIDN